MAGERLFTMRVSQRWVRELTDLAGWINAGGCHGPNLIEGESVTVTDLVALAVESVYGYAPPERAIGKGIREKYGYDNPLGAERIARAIAGRYNIHRRKLSLKQLEAEWRRGKLRLVISGNRIAG
jgi:hypothetical protein